MFKNFTFKKQAKAPSITKPTVSGTILAAALVGISGLIASNILKTWLAPKEEPTGTVRVFVIRQCECDPSNSKTSEDELVTPAFVGEVPHEAGSDLADEINKALNRNENPGNETRPTNEHESDSPDLEGSAANSTNASTDANGNGRKHRNK